jgi:hypothetical protein
MTRVFSAAALVLALAAASYAQTAITGKWQGETGNGSAIVLDVTATGTELKGTMTRNGESTPISDGTVSKNRISFKATLNDKAEGFTGEVDGDQMRIWLDRQGAEKAIVLKRVKG